MFLQMSVVGITGGISTGKSIAMTKHEGMTKTGMVDFARDEGNSPLPTLSLRERARAIARR